MKKIVIFSGTTEGRTLSEAIVEMGVPHTVCVATEYGELVMCESPLVNVHQGRLDEEEMKTFISQNADIVFDATHPFAKIVTDNIRKACESTGTEYVRVLRDGASDSSSYEAGTNMFFFEDMEECAEALRNTKGNILLTTGSKELQKFAGIEELSGRLFARVLPSVESIELCSKAGLQDKHVIAMHGPFTKEMNKAIIKQFEISVLVTKETGTTGGYPEKIDACVDAGIDACIIRRPREADGIGVAGAVDKVRRIVACEGLPGKLEISLIGIGPGNPELLTVSAKNKILEADILFGAERMLRGYENKEHYPYYLAEDVLAVLNEKMTDIKLGNSPLRIAVLFSGDSGFYSGAKKMKEGLNEGLEKSGIDNTIDILPGISSISYFAAKLQQDYSDASLYSIHGKSGDESAISNLIEELKRRGRVFTLLSGKDDVILIANELKGMETYRFILGYELSYENERIIDVSKLGVEDMSVLPKGSYIAYIELT